MWIRAPSGSPVRVVSPTQLTGRAGKLRRTAQARSGPPGWGLRAESNACWRSSEKATAGFLSEARYV